MAQIITKSPKVTLGHRYLMKNFIGHPRWMLRKEKEKVDGQHAAGDYR